MKRSEKGRTAWENETGQRREFDQHFVHFFQQQVCVILAQHHHPLGQTPGRSGHFSTEVEHFALKSVQGCEHHLTCPPDVGTRPSVVVPSRETLCCCSNHAKGRVDLVAQSDRFQTYVAL